MRERIAEPEVRIHSPPAMSLRTIGSGAIVQRIHPQHRNPKRCEHGLTPRVVELGPKRRHSPPGSGGVTPKLRCRRCERVAEPKVRIRSLQRRVRGSHRPGRCRSRTVAFARLCAARLAAPSAEERLALVQPGIVVLGQVRVCDSQWARMLILCAGQEHRVRQASGRCRAIHMGRTVPVSKQDIQIIR
jgi:hypothetical protein